MDDLLSVTLDEQISEIRRELDMRKRAYPVFVANKKLTQDRADRQTRHLRAALETLQKCRGSDA